MYGRCIWDASDVRLTNMPTFHDLFSTDSFVRFSLFLFDSFSFSHFRNLFQTDAQRAQVLCFTYLWARSLSVHSVVPRVVFNPRVITLPFRFALHTLLSLRKNLVTSGRHFFRTFVCFEVVRSIVLCRYWMKFWRSVASTITHCKWPNPTWPPYVLGNIVESNHSILYCSLPWPPTYNPTPIIWLFFFLWCVVLFLISFLYEE